VGSLGANFGLLNHSLFGYLSFLYPLGLMVSLFLWFKNPGFSLRRLEISLSSVLLFFTLTIFQGLIIVNELRGSIGGNFVDFLSPYIGTAGIWIFWLMSTSLAGMILLDKSFQEVAEVLKKLDLQAYLPKIPEKNQTEVSEATSSKNEEKIIEEVPETPIVKEIIEDEGFIPEPPVLYPKKEESLKNETLKPEKTREEVINEAEKSTIVEVAKKTKLVKEAESPVEKKPVEEKHAVIVSELEENKQLLDQIEKITSTHIIFLIYT